eukprot:TRINITY_DN3917_c0_g1_i1.p1 TRINITY_DN3917_c0_g1~~TRINITY_DN3917_c0_g1_i1.p1  ORF type:complete len:351 (-),score=74.15 TRINITY_DN3917_c0_g1_i1:263-1315(-)
MKNSRNPHVEELNWTIPANTYNNNSNKQQDPRSLYTSNGTRLEWTVYKNNEVNKSTKRKYINSNPTSPASNSSSTSVIMTTTNANNNSSGNKSLLSNQISFVPEVKFTPYQPPVTDKSPKTNVPTEKKKDSTSKRPEKKQKIESTLDESSSTKNTDERKDLNHSSVINTTTTTTTNPTSIPIHPLGLNSNSGITSLTNPIPTNLTMNFTSGILTSNFAGVNTLNSIHSNSLNAINNNNNNLIPTTNSIGLNSGGIAGLGSVGMNLNAFNPMEREKVDSNEEDDEEVDDNNNLNSEDPEVPMLKLEMEKLQSTIHQKDKEIADLRSQLRKVTDKYQSLKQAPITTADSPST